MDNIILECKNLRKRYGNIEALNSINLNIKGIFMITRRSYER